MNIFSAHCWANAAVVHDHATSIRPVRNMALPLETKFGLVILRRLRTNQIKKALAVSNTVGLHNLRWHGGAGEHIRVYPLTVESQTIPSMRVSENVRLKSPVGDH